MWFLPHIYFGPLSYGFYNPMIQAKVKRPSPVESSTVSPVETDVAFRAQPHIYGFGPPLDILRGTKPVST